MTIKKRIIIILLTHFIFLTSCNHSASLDSFDKETVSDHPDMPMMEGISDYIQPENLGIAQQLTLVDTKRKSDQESVLASSNTSTLREEVYAPHQSNPCDNFDQTAPSTQQKNPCSISSLEEIEKFLSDACVKNNYKKKVAVTTFPVIHSEHILDIPRANYEFAEILAKNLYENQNFIVRDVEEVNIFENYPNAPYPMAPRVDELQDNLGVVYLAEKIDAQFIISGVIQDFNFHESNDTARINPFNFLSTFPHERSFWVEMFIYDGLTGEVIYRHEYKNKARGKVYFPYITHMNSDEFLSSDIGEVVNEMIMTQVHDIDTKLSCLPLVEKILRVDGETVYFNAGALQNIHVGDTLLVYNAADKYTRSVYYQNTRLRGYIEKPKSILTVQKVQPLFSTGVLDIKNNGEIYPLDIVRSW